MYPRLFIKLTNQKPIEALLRFSICTQMRRVKLCTKNPILLVLHSFPFKEGKHKGSSFALPLTRCPSETLGMPS